MGQKVAGKSRKFQGHPYSRGIAVAAGVGTPAFPVDLTELSATGGGTGSPASGSKHAATGLLIFATTGGTLVYKDSAGVTVTVAIVGGATLPPTPLPVSVSEITSFAGASGTIIAYFDD